MATYNSGTSLQPQSNILISLVVSIKDYNGTRRKTCLGFLQVARLVITLIDKLFGSTIQYLLGHGSDRQGNALDLLNGYTILLSSVVNLGKLPQKVEFSVSS